MPFALALALACVLEVVALAFAFVLAFPLAPAKRTPNGPNTGTERTHNGPKTEPSDQNRTGSDRIRVAGDLDGSESPNHLFS